MEPTSIQENFRKKVCEHIQLESEGINRFRVLTPFLFDDGDHLSIVLKNEAGKWLLSDEGHTYMHLTYDIEEKSLRQGTKQKLISNALSTFSTEDREGEIIIHVQEDNFGDALYNFVQALLKITDVNYLRREIVRSAFIEEFFAYMEKTIPEDRREFNWHHPKHDPEGNYLVDCRINNSPQSVHVHALTGDDKTRDATISILNFEKWTMNFQSVAIFEDQEQIGRKVLARLTDVCDRQFSSLSGNIDRISRYLEPSR